MIDIQLVGYFLMFLYFLNLLVYDGSMALMVAAMSEKKYFEVINRTLRSLFLIIQIFLRSSYGNFLLHNCTWATLCYRRIHL